ncbi:TRAP transporter small permease [Endozoicomonas sp. SM1973]|uniref:TRAP transporter small permease protein n=1 Tax=Spartinivicinus marinus TaxID=2994442 RepID=A0A853HVY9_9GAMM|nr:TRAP transporter small permease [Spartinivicinus marinus]MCX4029171.1 TRAP transporter small permease [Spartinivicinus marinus]NYZ65920.1 TRAP transporter small permease [Spartinivicinus marinus]
MQNPTTTHSAASPPPQSTIRGILNFIYTASGALAGICILAITLLILAQSVGRWFGVIIPSTEDFSGFLLAASSFLGLAYTFRHGAHIRVNLVCKHLPQAIRHKLEIVVLFTAVLLGIFMSYYMAYMAYESYIFEEASAGYIPVPLWIPQTAPVIGLFIFTLALVDELITLLTGNQPAYLQAEQQESLEMLTEEGC